MVTKILGEEQNDGSPPPKCSRSVSARTMAIWHGEVMLTDVRLALGRTKLF